MDEKEYKALTKKTLPKRKPRTLPLSKAKQSYLEEGLPWSGGRGGKLAFKAWNMGRYDEAEELGYRVKRFNPTAVKFGHVITWLLSLFEKDEDGTD
ncbi:hypothetical protein [Acinetobacter boissieri]|uniref:Uncharacterized protein n=1 Tax=Acinetobacter boissieri TaxID=1219383 RepID=A0A1G6H3U2_9GAMM|nr:hypothetical protein [Acinetobacter boissieri]SDB88814.1 hypothetical protein SAMN05421733_103251 [Acinetobacter boissieri]